VVEHLPSKGRYLQKNKYLKKFPGTSGRMRYEKINYLRKAV
jgi:hypothetical protein